MDILATRARWGLFFKAFGSAGEASGPFLCVQGLVCYTGEGSCLGGPRRTLSALPMNPNSRSKPIKGLSRPEKGQVATGWKTDPAPQCVG